MTGALRSGFTEQVIEAFGSDQVTVVFHCKSGRGIRFWVPEYQQPKERDLSVRKMNSNGEEYGPLLKVAQGAMEKQRFDHVGLIWMQGESDGLNRLSTVYKESFKQLILNLKRDLQREDLFFVIGRISDYGLGGEQHDHWQRVRDAQVSLGQEENGAWIDTDDLNGGDDQTPTGLLHYPNEGSRMLGQRLAQKAITMIRQK